ncbi:hypothetical protein CLV51_105348 [Chitinophaga niastensis]|uniref:Uncharacterized protein n=1 Tax=Chitinophaga niastensis TaxID=536980 RepID=A0A2P8HFK9_CHINA|nr:hypothetical protein CLV51_105348 [Chitinophaga niastensis]
MPFEIDVLSVGKANSIILKWVNEKKEEFIILMDAGYKKDGEQIRDHIKRHTKKKKLIWPFVPIQIPIILVDSLT